MNRVTVTKEFLYTEVKNTKTICSDFAYLSRNRSIPYRNSLRSDYKFKIIKRFRTVQVFYAEMIIYGI